jgi:hypothetical protein
MEQHILKTDIKYRGHHKKGITIFNATKVSLQQKCSHEKQKCIFKIAEMKTMRNYPNLQFFSFLMSSSLPF